MVPDYLITISNVDELDEMKITGHGETYFNERTVERRCGGVEARAMKVPVEYRLKSRKGDRTYNNFDHSNGGKGPMELRLESFGRVRALVIGPRGEGSKDLHRLIDEAAAIGAERGWRMMGARSVRDAREAFISRIKRSVGITAVRAAARLKRERLQFFLAGGGAKATGRRTEGQARFYSMREVYHDLFSGYGANSRHRGC